MMTLEQFQASRTWCDDLGTALSDDLWAGEPKLAVGHLYLGTLYIEQVQDHWPEQAKAQGKWHLRLHRDERISDDLASLERDLYEFAKVEGYLESSIELSPDRIATAHAATFVAIWAAWDDNTEDALDDALRLTAEAVRKLDLHQVAGNLASPLNYFVRAHLDEDNPEDLTYGEMMDSMAIAVSQMTKRN